MDNETRTPDLRSLSEQSASKMPPVLSETIGACRAHAADLLISAETIQAQGLHNIAYHLATLALEETGKAELIGLIPIGRLRGRDGWIAKQMEDHAKKLFWALWGPSFGRDLITKEHIETFIGLAERIHATRKRGIYVEISDDAFTLPKDAISIRDTEQLISLARARLEMAIVEKPRDLTEEDQLDLDWFLDATDDPEKRRSILGKGSMEQLVTLGHPRSWMRWLREEFEKAEFEGRRQAEAELRRPAPSSEEAPNPKWKMRIRLYTNSHSIRSNQLAEWNGSKGWITLLPVDNKKNQLLVDFTLPRAIAAQSLYCAGWHVARRFTVALNIASFGFFWWYVPEHISRYYEQLRDLEVPNAEVRMERSPTLSVDWRRDVLTVQDLRECALCFGMLPDSEDPKVECFNHYSTGLALMSKNDIHLQCERPAYEHFAKAFQAGMKAYGDWDDAGTAIGNVQRIMMGVVGNEEEVQVHLRLIDQFENGPEAELSITLREVASIKLLCDGYFLRTFRRLHGQRKEEDRLV